MEGTAQSARLAEYAHAHPEVSFCCVEGTWYAWKPAADGGELSHGRDEDELLAKLQRQQ